MVDKKSRKKNYVRVGRRYRPGRLSEVYDAVVIGSGIGGLATGALLAKQGQKVAIFEQHYTAGGFTHSYERKGYEWDVGVHYVGDVGTQKALVKWFFDYISNGELKWSRMDDNYDEFRFGSKRYHYMAGRKKFKRELLRRFPNEKKAINEYIRVVRNVYSFLPFYFIDKAFTGRLGKITYKMRNVLFPWYFNRETREVIEHITDNSVLAGVLTAQWGDYGVAPRESSFLMHGTIAYHFMREGGYYPVGGASSIAKSIIPVIRSSGGEVFTIAEVENVCLKGDKVSGVKMKDGTHVNARVVVSDAGVLNTYNKLLPTEWISKESGRIQDRLGDVVSGDGHMCLYVGLKGDANALGFPNRNIWRFPDQYHDSNLEKYFSDYRAPFPFVLMSFPSSKDPCWDERKPGRSTIEVIVPARYQWFEKWDGTLWLDRGEEYSDMKEYFSQRMIEVLIDEFPNIEYAIEYYELSTPLSTKYFCHNQIGEAYGIKHTTDRFDQEWVKPKTEIKGLYITGQDVITCGVTGALMSAILTSITILRLRHPYLLIVFIVKAIRHSLDR